MRRILSPRRSRSSRGGARAAARHDLHRHTWTVERVELVDTKSHGRVVVTGGGDGRRSRGAHERFRRNETGKNPVGNPVVRRLGTFPRVHGSLRERVGQRAGRYAVARRRGDTNGRVWVWGYDANAPRHAWAHGGSITTVRFAPTISNIRVFDGKESHRKERKEEEEAKLSWLPPRRTVT